MDFFHNTLVPLIIIKFSLVIICPYKNSLFCDDDKSFSTRALAYTCITPTYFPSFLTNYDLTIKMT